MLPNNDIIAIKKATAHKVVSLKSENYRNSTLSTAKYQGWFFYAQNII